MTEFDPATILDEIKTQRLSKGQLTAKLDRIKTWLKEVNENIADPDEIKNYLPIKKLGLVRSAYAVRHKCKSSDESQYESSKLISCQGVKINAIDRKSNSISFALAETYSLRKIDKYKIKRGDILIPLRNNFDPILINDIPDNTIAVGEWLILTIDETIMYQDFFLWYWRSHQTQERMQQGLTKYSNKMKYLAYRELKEFKIDCPSIDIQLDIIAQYQADLTLEIEQRSNRIKLLNNLYQLAKGNTL